MRENERTKTAGAPRADVRGTVGDVRQVRPQAEGWKQAKDSEGRPLLQFASPKRGKPPVHLADLTPEERIEKVKELGLPGFRAKQLAKHYFERYTRDPEKMTDLPKAGREELVAGLLPNLLTEVRRLQTDSGDTIKFLWKLHDGALVESVLMRYPGRITLCVSSQAGCGMNCPFCATGQNGLTRNMSAAEIVDQVVRANEIIANGELGGKKDGDNSAELASGHLADGKTATDRIAPPRGATRVSNIVFMGMGEPLANYKRVIQAVRTMVDKKEGLGMSARGITVSTVGLAPAIRKLTEEDIPVTFALSLHAPDDELRDEMIPVNSRWKVGEVLDAARAYFDRTGRRVSIEYALIRDMNDHPWRAELLASKLNSRGKGWVHVNPIPLNPTPGSVWDASTKAAQNEFMRILNDAGIPTTIRDTRGKEIDGACGQLVVTEEDERAGAAA